MGPPVELEQALLLVLAQRVRDVRTQVLFVLRGARRVSLRLPPRDLGKRGEARGERLLQPRDAVRVDGAFRPYALQVLTFRADGKLTDVTAFVSPELFPFFGLPASL